MKHFQAYLQKKFPTKNVKYVGGGTDSVAFKIETKIYRFPCHGADVYKMEAALCDFIRPAISADIPKIEVITDGPYTYAVHEMVTGEKWSWHKFSWSPRRQKNLARTYAQFLAQLHGVDVAALGARVPAITASVPYCDWNEISDFLARFMTPGQMRFFHKNYERVIGAPVRADDMVFVHMGMKGANSVVDANGNLTGVFDFCGGGVYERGRDFVLCYLGRNGPLFRAVLREYDRMTGGRAPAASRIKDLAVIEFLWRCRLFPNGVFQPRNDHFIMKNIAVAMARFHRLPKPLYWVVYARIWHHVHRGKRA